MTPEQRQEEVSKAYLHAVAAKCGFAIAGWSQDHGCVDVTIAASAALEPGSLARPKVDIQLKATTQQHLEHAEYVSWELEMPHYNSLRAPALSPHLLVVLMLPANVDESVEHSVDHLLIRRCAYWVKMTGMPEVLGQNSKTVRLPKSQPFSPDSLREILVQIGRKNF